MVQSHQVQDGRVQIADVDSVFDCRKTQFVRCSNRLATFHSSACQPHGESMPVVIPSGLADAFDQHYLVEQVVYRFEGRGIGTQVRILGKIDRIDCTPEGKFVVLDYKTGRTSGSLSAIREGLSLQLPIYLLAIENLLGTAGLDEGVAGAYYELRDHEHCGKTGLFANKSHKDQVYRTQSQVVEHEAFRTALEQTRSFVLAYVRNIQQGRFHVTPHPPDKTCSHCLYKQSCRLDARRMQLLKRQGKLT